jgi:hypothetical protein
MDVVFIQTQFPSDLEIGEIQTHEIQAQDPDPQRLMVAGQNCPGQVIEATAAFFATVALAVALCFIVTIADHRMARTARTLNAVGPSVLTDPLVALLVINERSEVDQLRDGHGDTESVGNWPHRIDQSPPQPSQIRDSRRVSQSWLQSHLTTPKSRMSHRRMTGTTGQTLGATRKSMVLQDAAV